MNLSNVPVVILAGGLGTRFESLTKSLPKPLIKIGKDPIILHVIRIYLHQGFRNFFLAGGYKFRKLKNFFKIKKKNIFFLDGIKCHVNIVNTGINTMTGGRLKIISKKFNDKIFMLTYGDGLCNVNLKKLFKFHIRKRKLITVTAVNPPPRFGQLLFQGKNVKEFSEKKKIKNIWINGGFFVVNRTFIKLIKNKKTILERDPLENAVKKMQLCAYKHKGFWECIDTRRDRDKILLLLKKKNYPWMDL